MNRVVRHWWTRRCGVREVLVLSLPLVISTSSWTLMNFIDRMFLMWHSKEELAAAMPAGMMYFTLVCIPMGIALYVNTFVAQYHGAGRNERIGPVVWLGAMIAAGSTPLFFLTIPIVPQLFVIAGHAHDVARLEATYFQVLTFGAGGAVMCAALSTFFTGRGETSVVMYANITQSVLNIVLDYLWIFGHAGFPEMGIAGAGWATIVSIWVKAAIYAVLIRRPRYWTAYGFANGWRAEWQQFLRLLKYGGPSGLQMAVDCSAFTIFIMFVGLLGTDALAASTLAFNVNSVAFIPMIGLSIAVTTLVGRNQGAKRPRLSTRAAWTGFCLAAAYMGTFAVLYVTVPDLFLIGHSMGSAPEQFFVVRAAALVYLRFVAAFAVFNAMSIIFAGAIKGAGDTHFILKTSTVMSITLIGLSWFATSILELGVLALWSILTAWTMVVGMIYLSRFLGGKWRTMLVIEPDTIDQRGNADRAPTVTLPVADELGVVD